MTWMDLLYIVAGASCATGVGVGIVLGVWIGNRANRRPADSSECGSTCALAALPRDRDVLVRHRRARRTPA